MQVLSLCWHKDVDAYDAGATAEAFCRLCAQLADDEEMVMECYAEMVRTLAGGGVEIAGIHAVDAPSNYNIVSKL